MLHITPLFSVFFGDVYSQFFPNLYKETNAKNLCEVEPFASALDRLPVDALIFSHQVHGDDGRYVSSLDDIKDEIPFSIDGDFLVTNQKQIGLAVATADCLPVIVFDKVTQSVGIAHVGWRGAVQDIVWKMLQKMNNEYGTNHKQVKIFFGPSARQCCYQVGQDFVDARVDDPHASSALLKRADQWYFDTSKYVKHSLKSRGISSGQYHDTYNVCTICHMNFCSYRRNNKAPERQFSVVSLK